MQTKKHISKNKKQGFCVKMERKHFAGPRNILQKKKARFFCCFSVFFENLANWTHNWSLD